MNTFIPKVVAAVVSLGGAIAVLSETKGSDNQEDLLSQNTSLTAKPKRRVPNRNNCNIYLVDYVSKYHSNSTLTREVNKFEEQFWTKDEFLQEIEEKNLWDKASLKEKVEKACDGGKRAAFVWWGKSQNDKPDTLVFHEGINGDDWLNKEGVSVPEYWKEEWNRGVG
ncbi:hypothetical protein MHC_04065 [Mycoplasma haemocanis str. Illinois]|uniref:Uncharacterized protein n=1 Tax=Mycoplasma haemocanis (strain Illinois) TaxID=1111676 RepID=H6N7P7_MYCHN|nr:hypothetical protein [Mycoplasma haemocanis]AEW45669.1 hypothetical protein MHC_04065 [Mycoplasma haemocanis str. Illinois]